MPPKATHVTDIRDVQVIKHDRGFMLSDDGGDVPKDNTSALGLYYKDTRFLSRFELSMNRTKRLTPYGGRRSRTAYRRTVLDS